MCVSPFQKAPLSTPTVLGVILWIWSVLWLLDAVFSVCRLAFLHPGECHMFGHAVLESLGTWILLSEVGSRLLLCVHHWLCFHFEIKGGTVPRSLVSGPWTRFPKRPLR